MSGIVLSENSMLDHMGGKEMISSTKIATAENFNSMFSHLKKLIKKSASDIYSGSFPIRKSSDACTWCDYTHLCRFDLSFSGCSLKEHESLKDEEVWEILKEEGNDNEMDN